MIQLSAPGQLGSFSTDARKAIVENPDYFVWWYTVKSVGLCVVSAALAFTIGRGLLKSKRCKR